MGAYRGVDTGGRVGWGKTVCRAGVFAGRIVLVWFGIAGLLVSASPPRVRRWCKGVAGVLVLFENTILTRKSGPRPVGSGGRFCSHSQTAP